MSNHQNASLFFNAEKQELAIAPGAIIADPIALAAYGQQLRVCVGAGARVTFSDSQLMGETVAGYTFVLETHSAVQYRLELSAGGQCCAPTACMQEVPVTGVCGDRSSVSVCVILCGQQASFVGALCVRDVAKGTLEINLMQQHEEPITTSSFVVRQVLFPGLTTTVRGTIVVDKAAHHVHAEQQLRGIVVEHEKESKTSRCSETVPVSPFFCMRPTLAVANHTAVVKHGCAVGELDGEQLFYMQSRGVPIRRAKELLLAAFFACP